MNAGAYTAQEKKARSADCCRGVRVKQPKELEADLGFEPRL